MAAIWSYADNKEYTVDDFYYYRKEMFSKKLWIGSRAWGFTPHAVKKLISVGFHTQRKNKIL